MQEADAQRAALEEEQRKRRMQEADAQRAALEEEQRKRRMQEADAQRAALEGLSSPSHDAGQVNQDAQRAALEEEQRKSLEAQKAASDAQKAAAEEEQRKSDEAQTAALEEEQRKVEEEQAQQAALEAEKRRREEEEELMANRFNLGGGPFRRQGLPCNLVVDRQGDLFIHLGRSAATRGLCELLELRVPLLRKMHATVVETPLSKDDTKLVMKQLATRRSANPDSKSWVDEAWRCSE